MVSKSNVTAPERFLPADEVSRSAGVEISVKGKRIKTPARFRPAAVCALVLLSPRVLPAAEVAAADYLQLVVRYAETLVEKGRDVYGEQHSPLIAITLDRKTMKLFQEKNRKRLF